MILIVKIYASYRSLQILSVIVVPLKKPFVFSQANGQYNFPTFNGQHYPGR